MWMLAPLIASVFSIGLLIGSSIEKVDPSTLNAGSVIAVVVAHVALAAFWVQKIHGKVRDLREARK